MDTTFSPFSSFFGGSLIGLSAVLLMLTLGRIMGATGILTGALLPDSPAERGWRVALLLGMFTAPAVYVWLSGEWPTVTVTVPTPFLIIGGLLVGVGVTLGSGCTSGHGVCGLARLSQRSMVAVASFMCSTVVTVYVVRHWMGISS